MDKNITSTNQNAKIILNKSKSLLNTTKSLLVNHQSKEQIKNFENFRFSIKCVYSGV